MSEKWNVDGFAFWKAEDFPVGGVCLEGGNSAEYITGGWRAMRPVWNQENCKNCLLCWVVCPDASILVRDETMVGIDYDHCKGCGVCVKECHFDALEMVLESQAKGGE